MAAHEIVIDRSPSEVFTWLDDPQKARQWVPGLVDIQPITPGGSRAGAKARHVYRENGRTFETEEEMLIYEPNRHIKIRGRAAGFEMTAEYQLSPTGAGTLLRFESTLRFNNPVMRLLTPLLTRGADQRTVQDLQRLKALVEAGGSAT
ncbi:MAG: SRPBCC family protein [Chloroflexi bacterium]|nr:SRPBCC family protein [Chloroflexota bacterium]